MRIIITTVSLFLICSMASAGNINGSAGSDGQVEARYLIDMPTAGILHNGMIGMDVNFYEQSGLLMSLEAGAFNRLTFGLSYGGTNIIGSGSVDWNKLPGVNIRFRVIDETADFPAIAIGFDSQGKDPYVSRYDRYLYKSPGFFAAGSKYFNMLGYFGLHGGINYSLENKDGNKNINFYVGADKTIGSDISVIAEYNFGLNDNLTDTLRLAHPGPGYLNAGVRWSVGNGFTVEFDYKNLFDLKKTESVRTVRIEYVQTM
ncbi:MAG TPA: YjbH domain-containing protein [Candidatus Acidoferrales bacterium]|nr:YjbH domain-containing protein [Candidatus Acidoferrales bacterium]